MQIVQKNKEGAGRIRKKEKTQIIQQGRKKYFTEDDDINILKISLSNVMDSKGIGDFFVKEHK